MIGYNLEKIEELASTLAKNYKTIGEKMADGWATLSSTMETEWVGPDEVSYETELAKNICALYVSCTDTVKNMVQNIKILGQNWVNFQKNNTITGVENSGPIQATASEVSAEVTLDSYDIATVVKAGNPSFSPSTNMGLTNGAESGTNIKTSFDTYIDGVYTSVQGLYTNLDASTAFLGSELNVKIAEYLANLGEQLAKLTTCHKSIYEAIDTLVANYSTHESDEAESVSEASTDIDFKGQNLK